MCSRLFLGMMMMMMMATRRTERDVRRVIWLKVGGKNHTHLYSLITFNSNSFRGNTCSAFLSSCLEKKKVAGVIAWVKPIPGS